MTTVRELVFGDEAGEVRAAERFAHDVSIAEAAVAAVSQALDFEVSDVVVWAWKTRSALLEAAHETRATPGLAREVTVKTYALPWDYEMHLDVVINGTRSATVKFVLSIALEITALAATVQDGQLVSLKSGRCKASASLEAEGRMLAEREMVLDLMAEVKVGDGIALIPEAVESPDDEPSQADRP
ncbi:MAG TPA: hypothetical protein VFC19_50350 [Candidatus Limnocylindrales bacterium]|nr:hypothetical protein [Candidatus Limnocylindrales bacterium]